MQLRAFVVALLVAGTLTPWPGLAAERRGGRRPVSQPAVVTYVIGPMSRVTVNPWNDAGQRCCSVVRCGGTLEVDVASGTARLRLEMLDDEEIRPGLTLDGTRVHCTTIDPPSIDGEHVWTPDWLAVDVQGPWTPPAEGRPAHEMGHLDARGRASLGGHDHAVALHLGMTLVADETGRQVVSVFGEFVPAGGETSAPRPWLLRLSADAEARKVLDPGRDP